MEAVEKEVETVEVEVLVEKGAAETEGVKGEAGKVEVEVTVTVAVAAATEGVPRVAVELGAERVGGVIGVERAEERVEAKVAAKEVAGMEVVETEVEVARGGRQGQSGSRYRQGQCGGQRSSTVTLSASTQVCRPGRSHHPGTRLVLVDPPHCRLPFPPPSHQRLAGRRG